MVCLPARGKLLLNLLHSVINLRQTTILCDYGKDKECNPLCALTGSACSRALHWRTIAFHICFTHCKPAWAPWLTSPLLHRGGRATKGLGLAKSGTFSALWLFISHQGTLSVLSKNTCANHDNPGPAVAALSPSCGDSSVRLIRAASSPSGQVLHPIGWSTFGLCSEMQFALLSLQPQQDRQMYSYLHAAGQHLPL